MVIEQQTDQNTDQREEENQKIDAQNSQKVFTVNCPNEQHPIVYAQKASKHFRADFDLTICNHCPFNDICPTKSARNHKKQIGRFRFKNQDVQKQKRHRSIQKIPKERRTLRPGVENLMGLMHRGEKHTGKLRVRGRFNIELYTFSLGIAINFERIFRFLAASKNTFQRFFETILLCKALQRISLQFLRANFINTIFVFKFS